MGQTESPLRRRAAWKVGRAGSLSKHQDFRRVCFFKRKKKTNQQNNNGRERRKLEVKDVAIPEA